MVRAMGAVSDFLFAPPSALSGIASVSDLGATMFMFNESGSVQQADFFALRQDWLMIGNDMKAAVGKLRRDVANVEATNQPAR